MKETPDHFSFTIVFSKARNWDGIRGGWSSSALRLPGAKVNKIYAAGGTLDREFYTLEEDFICWKGPTKPPHQICVMIDLTQALSLNDVQRLKVETLRWQRRASVAAILMAVVTALFLVTGYVLQQGKAERAELEQSTHEIYEVLTERMKMRQEFIQHLRRENFLLRQIDDSEGFAFIAGIVVSDAGEGLSDAQIKIEESEDDSILSSPSGYFFIRGNSGQKFIVEKDGYQRESRVLTPKDFADEMLVVLYREK